jgi:catechol 2,3-dioxygenase-like lactoylglutathione lyase family enzyme
VRHARAFFFVKDAERSLHFYTETHGFALIVIQGALGDRAPYRHGRVFIGLDPGE